MDTEPVIVTIAHLRAEKFCASGVRAFARERGLDWARFLREGIPADELEACGDALAIRVAERARAEVNARG